MSVLLADRFVWPLLVIWHEICFMGTFLSKLSEVDQVAHLLKDWSSGCWLHLLLSDKRNVSCQFPEMWLSGGMGGVMVGLVRAVKIRSLKSKSLWMHKTCIYGCFCIKVGTIYPCLLGEMHIVPYDIFPSLYEQISLVNKTGNQRSVNICCYPLIIEHYRFTAGPAAAENVFLSLRRGSLQRVANAICKCETN